MKFYILLLSLYIQFYKSQLCETIKSCYNCSVSKFNCSWFENSCSQLKSNEYGLNNRLNNSYLSYPFINAQYRCIKNEKDIEYFEEINNKTIYLKNNQNNDDKINYHIYCFKYISIQNVTLKINYSEEFKNNILEISIFDNIKNSDTILNPINNNINIQSNYFCLKMTYLNEIKLTESIVSFYVTKNNNRIIKEKYFYLSSFIILIIFIFLSFFALSMFIIWHKNKSKENEIIITNKPSKFNKLKYRNNPSFSNDKSIDSNYSKNNEQSECDKTDCSELQEKYLQSSKDSFVENNYETIDSFIHNIHDIEKKDIYLKAIIKTLPYFIVNKKDNEFIGIFCSFCESKIKLNDKICFINCGHIFHFDCIYQQIITNEEYKCIICGENITI